MQLGLWPRTETPRVEEGRRNLYVAEHYKREACWQLRSALCPNIAIAIANTSRSFDSGSHLVWVTFRGVQTGVPPLSRPRAI